MASLSLICSRTKRLSSAEEEVKCWRDFQRGTLVLVTLLFRGHLYSPHLVNGVKVHYAYHKTVALIYTKIHVSTGVKIIVYLQSNPTAQDHQTIRNQFREHGSHITEAWITSPQPPCIRDRGRGRDTELVLCRTLYRKSTHDTHPRSTTKTNNSTDSQ